jgi:hypothetical protein
MAKTPSLQARALSDNGALGIKCGQILEGPEKVVRALAESGAVDDHPDAVAYAKDNRAEVIVLQDPDAAAELAAATVIEPTVDADAPQDPAAQ